MTRPVTVNVSFHIEQRRRGRKQLEPGAAPPVRIAGRIPRVSRLMALSHRFERLLKDRVVVDQVELARLGHVTRARISQIMNLLHLAPDIQEEILFLPRVERGRDTVILRELQPIAGEVNWQQQRRMWKKLLARKA